MDLSKQDNKQIDQLINYNHISDTLMWLCFWPYHNLIAYEAFYPHSGAEPTVLPLLGGRTGRSTTAAPAISRPIPSCHWGRTDRSTPALG